MAEKKEQKEEEQPKKKGKVHGDPIAEVQW